ncbi:MAG: sulfite exporter TauE/SafE family protein [Hyphomicrobiaceae bacterium]|nr:MAG: sulfite exporter TauE/SafE family protein [Hyphomicrobiaceae bacterium]
MHELTLYGLLTLAVSLLGAGLLTGFVAGLLGIGGGGIMVPVLYEMFGLLGVPEAIRMHASVGTSLAVIVPTSLTSFKAHRARGFVDMDVLRSMAPWVVAGVLIGALTARYANRVAMQSIWAGAATLIAVRMLFAREDWRLGDNLPGNPGRALYAMFTGFISVLMSIGGGAFISTFMTLYGRNIHSAVSTASGFGPLVSIPGAIGFAVSGWGASGLPPGSIGYVSLIGAALLIPSTVLAAPIGVRAAHGLSRRNLEIAFGVFMAAVALKYVIALLL